MAGSCGKKSNSTGSNGPPDQGFTNPLLPTGPDPWVTSKDNVYYYTHTLGNRISIWKTTRMSDLRNVTPKTIWTAPTTGTQSKNVWAPEIHYISNKWYIYYSAGSSDDLATQRTFVLENGNADPLTGNWTDKGQIGDTTANQFAIDGTVFTYKSANYFIWSGQANDSDKTQRLYIASMLNPWTLSSGRVMISSPKFEWETQGAPPAVNEGPEILQNGDGRIFLIYSASGCWTDQYSLGMITLKADGNPLHPEDWTKYSEPVFSTNAGNHAYGPGHNSFFTSPDGSENWILYHANNLAGQGCKDTRNPRMQQFTWNADGTPSFGEPAPTGELLQLPAGE